ncbi:carboxyl transferase domain-containing protein [Streptomyces sp. TRM 70351]|uniref:carboxyl transferase domain-containing protein n=1 Tax=Streptomyces sp. TRM 70351 TaxID=3116552 RepID=UPI002E7BDE4D|nr:carboxyl transferase domain-containing protein [Streptomyces sp. TRM 70351]MEE1930821.1 carboxyl transferase domain-containing protein [Streptomyces sp. TRM 70351]
MTEDTPPDEERGTEPTRAGNEQHGPARLSARSEPQPAHRRRQAETVQSISRIASRWRQCPRCSVWADTASRSSDNTCGICAHSFPLSARQRITLLVDHDSFHEHDAMLEAGDPLCFTDRVPYPERHRAARQKTGLHDAAVYGTCAIGGHPTVMMVLDFDFMGGTMGVVVGEKFLRAARLAIERAVPLTVVSASGGGRIQEGTFALFQGLKTATAVALLRETSTPFLSVLTDPVFGGVAVSYSSIGDVVIAEQGTRAGFAGRKVIERTIGAKLPADFQTSDFLLRHGHVDIVATRRQLRPLLQNLIAFAARSALPPGPGEPPHPHVSAAPASGWQAVALARHRQRPRLDHYRDTVFHDMVTLHGDRSEGDDPALLTALGWLDQRRVALIGHVRGPGGFDPAHNWGMPSPCGYRKATRVMRLAARWGIPIVTLIDTPGAYPGPRAEENNQCAAIAETLATAARLPVPIVCVVIGEGGSGGGLALCLGDRLLIQENATLSVISPEGGAALLFGTTAQAPHIAARLRLRADDLHRHGLVDEIVAEPDGGAHWDPAAAAALLKAALRRTLAETERLDTANLLTQREKRLTSFGTVWDLGEETAPRDA